MRVKKSEESQNSVRKKNKSFAFASSEILSQPEINIGLVGHVDHGKTTLVSKLSGKWTDTHSEELKRGITIKLGYADTTFFLCKKCGAYNATKTCKICKSECGPTRKISFIDSPGHETLMATMLSGAAIIDGALLLIAANEQCPQPQTKEHLMALEIVNIKNIIIVQNKIDLVSYEEAFKNYEQIKQFVKGTVAENAPIIPVSAQHEVNIDALIFAIETLFKTPQRELTKEPLAFIVRSFDVNKPGTNFKELIGGVLGGAVKQGALKQGRIEIRPGRRIENKDIWKPLFTKIAGLKAGNKDIQEALPGGSIGILTELDPFLTKADKLVGNIAGLPAMLPPVWYKFCLRPHLLQRVVGTKEELVVESIKKGELLMLNVNAAATVGVVYELEKDNVLVNLKIPVCAKETDRVTVSRKIGARWRLIGWAEIRQDKDA